VCTTSPIALGLMSRMRLGELGRSIFNGGGYTPSSLSPVLR
jgi:hypothetical protein